MSVLTGQHALVTGANRGIGAAVATVLSANGAAVTLMVRDRAAGERVQQSLAGKSVVVVADITDDPAVQRACRESAESLGAVSLLVNNAGSAVTAPFMRTSNDMFERMMAEHLYGPLSCIRAVLPAMMSAGFGRIVNIASVAGVSGAAYVTAYTSAKHAMVGLTRSLAKETIAKGVTVNAVCPGYTDTDLVSRGVSDITAKTGRSADEARGMLIANNPLQRLITPEEVASAVLWLCTPGAASTSGQTIIIDGGELA
ncbi:MAG: SDR family NAD(P)-dependent oxidoreductase [Gemmatimonas sp.]